MKIWEDGVIRDATPEELAQAEKDKLNFQTVVVPTNVRRQRNQRLAETDWSQMADTPQAIRDKYAAYRQALRDVPQQAGFPNNVVWPTKPE